MRQKGNLRLLMNANLWAEMQVTKMEGGKASAAATTVPCPARPLAGGARPSTADTLPEEAASQRAATLPEEAASQRAADAATCVQGATFVCVNAAAAGEETTPGKKDAAKEAATEPKEAPAAAPQLSTFAARFKTADDVEGFATAVDGAKAAPAREAAA